MTNPTQKSTTPNWEQTRTENQRRAERIRQLFQAAAADAFVEIRAGAADLNDVTRKSVADRLTALEHGDDTAADPKATATSDAAIPTWRSLMLKTLGIVRDRQGDWAEQAKQRWQTQAAKVDGTLTEEYGDRYHRAKSIFQRVLTWLGEAQAHGRSSHQPGQPSEPAATPVTIEVIDGNDTPVIRVEPKPDLPSPSSPEAEQSTS